MGLFSRIVMVFKTKASSVLDRAEDPRQLVDYAYSQQQELLRKTKQGLIEVATSKVRLTQQAQRLRAQIPHMDEQAGRALEAGREDLARIALQRKQTILAELVQLDRQAAEIADEEKRLTHTEKELSARIEEFRVRRDSISARYTAAQAQVRVTEALSGVSGEFADLSMALGRAVEKTERMQARASAIGALLEVGSLSLPTQETDLVERELHKALVEQTVDDELKRLKAGLDEGRSPSALKSAAEDETTSLEAT